MLDIAIDSSVSRNSTSTGVNATITLSHHTNTTSRCSMRTLVSLEAHTFHNVVVLGTYTLDATVRSPHTHHPADISHEKYQLGIAVFSLLGTIQKSLGFSIHRSPFVQSSLYQLQRILRQWIDEFHIHAIAQQRLDDERALERFVAFGERQTPYDGCAHTQQQRQDFLTPSPTSTQATQQSNKPSTPSPTSTTVKSPSNESSARVGPPVYTFNYTPPCWPSLSCPSGLRSHDHEGHVILHRRPNVVDHDILNASDVADAQAGDKTDDEDEEIKRTRWEDRKESGYRALGQKSPFARGPTCSDTSYLTASMRAEPKKREGEKKAETAVSTSERFYRTSTARRRNRDEACYDSSDGGDGKSDWSAGITTKRKPNKTRQESSPRSCFASSVPSSLYDVCDFCDL